MMRDSGDDGDSDDQTAEEPMGGDVAAPGPLQAGAILAGRYHLDQLLGQGGSGMVFRATDVVVDEAVAIKVLRPERAAERSWIRRLVREVKLARAIRHPNVCRFFEVGQADGHWFIIMELADNGTLRQLLRGASGPDTTDDVGGGIHRPWDERLADARAVCAGLAAIHAVGIVHRDVTPQNILRTNDGRLMISDFGLAIAEHDSTTFQAGTPSYMPPEVLQGQRSDQRSDVWQLGALLHEILFGQRPVWQRRGERLELLPPVSANASSVEDELARLCIDCLASSPALRPVSAVAVSGRFAAAEATPPRSWLMKQTVRARRALVRRRLPIAVAAACVSLVSVAAWGLSVAGRRPLCGGAESRLTGIWDGQVKATIARAFGASGQPHADKAISIIGQTLDDYSRRWKSVYTETCQATHIRDEQSTEVLDLRMACLNDRANELKALTKVFSAAPDERAVQSAASATGSLTDVDRCSDVALLRAVVKPPDSAKIRGEVSALRFRLAEVKALDDTGHTPEALTKARAVVAEADAVGYAPLQAEARYRLGAVQFQTDGKAAEAVMEQALWAALTSRHDEVAAESAVGLVHITGVILSQPDRALLWQRHAEALLRRIGGHPLLESWLLNNVGTVLILQNRYSEALEVFQRAMKLKSTISGIAKWDLALGIVNIANAQNSVGRHEEALDNARRADPILRRELGTHFSTAIHLSNMGEIFNNLTRYEEARRLFEEALSMWNELKIDPTIKSYAMTGMGISLVESNQSGKAIDILERALEIRAKQEGTPALHAETAFALARALWDSGRDRRRAVTLATGAHAHYKKAGLASQTARVAAWLSDPARGARRR